MSWSVFAIYGTDQIMATMDGGVTLEKYILAFTKPNSNFAVQATHYLRDNILSVPATQQRFDHARKTVEFVETSDRGEIVVNHGLELIRKGWVKFDSTSSTTPSPEYAMADKEFKESPAGKQGTGRVHRFGLKNNKLNYPLGDEAAAEDPDAVEALGLHMIHAILEGYVEKMYSPTCFDFRTQNNTIFKVQVCGLTTDEPDLRDGKITRAAEAHLLHRFMILMVEEYDSTKRVLLVNPGTDLFPYAELISNGHVRVDPTTLSFAARFAVDKYLKTEEAEIAAENPESRHGPSAKPGQAAMYNAAGQQQQQQPDTNIWLKEPRNFNRDEVLQFQATVVAVLSHNEVVVAKEPRDRGNVDPTYYNIRLPFVASCAGRNLLPGFPGQEIIATGLGDGSGKSDANAAEPSSLNVLRKDCHRTLYESWKHVHSQLMGRTVDVTPIHSFAHPESSKRVQYARVATVRPEQAFGLGTVAEGVEPATELLAKGMVELEPLDLFPLGICLQPSTDYYQCASRGQAKISTLKDDEVSIVGGLSGGASSSASNSAPAPQQYAQIFDQALLEQQKAASPTATPAVAGGYVQPIQQQVEPQTHILARVVDLESPTRLLLAIETGFEKDEHNMWKPTTVNIIRVSVHGLIAPEKEIDSEQYFMMYTEACKVLCGVAGSLAGNKNNNGSNNAAGNNNTNTSPDAALIQVRFIKGCTSFTPDGEEIPEVAVMFGASSSSNELNTPNGGGSVKWEDYGQWLINNGAAAPSGSNNTVDDRSSFQLLVDKMRSSFREANIGIWSPKGDSMMKSLERTRTKITGVTTDHCYDPPREGHLLYVRDHNDFYIWWIDTVTDDAGCVLSPAQQQQLQKIAKRSPDADVSTLAEGNMVFIFVQGMWHRALVAAVQPEPLFVPVDQFCVGGVPMATLRPAGKRGTTPSGDSIIKFITDPEDIAILQNELPVPNVIRAHHAFLTFNSNTTTDGQEDSSSPSSSALGSVEAFTKSYIDKYKVIDVAVEYQRLQPPFSTGVSLIPKDASCYPSQLEILRKNSADSVQVDLKMSLFVTKFSDKIRAMRSIQRPGAPASSTTTNGVDAVPL